MYSVFGDESADKKRERVFAVAGLIGSEEEWQSLRIAWLQRTGGKIFHASDCETDGGDFAGIDHQDNLKLYADLTQLIAKSKLLGFGAAISLDDHKILFPSALPHQPYHMCFRWVVSRFAEIAATLVPQDKVQFTFDHNIETEYNTAVLYRYMLTLEEFKYREYLADEVSFATRKNIGIQAADLVARETMKHMDNVLGPVRRNIRKSMAALANTKLFWFEFYTKEYLEDLRKKTIAGILPGHNMTEYDAWRAPLRLQDTGETRIRYQLYLHELERHKSKTVGII